MTRLTRRGHPEQPGPEVRGSSVVEAVVAMALGLFLLHLALVTLDRLRFSETRSRARHDIMLSARVVRGVVGRELRYLDTERDLQVEGEALSLRAFRGAALACAADAEASAYLVAFVGARRPDPAKDSLELVFPDGTVSHVALAGASDATEPCALAGWMSDPMVWQVDSMPAAIPVALRLYERGSYHLSGSAFRYRVGAGGRQPLTPEVWDDRETGWHATDVSLSVVLTPRDGAEAWHAFLGWMRR